MVVEVGRSFATEDCKFVVEKGLDACKTEVGEVSASVEKLRYALHITLACVIAAIGSCRIR
jgi:hypothetical protein